MIGVLVVDDDIQVARIHRGYVEKTPGFRVTGVVHSAADALSSVRLHRPDLVLLDIHLPDASGLEVLRALRSDEYAALDVIVLTASREVDTVRAALHGGVVTYLVKPFSYGTLAERLRAYAAGRQQEADGPLGQDEVDRLLAVGRQAPPAPLPKGLTAASLALVVEALRGVEDLSSAEAAEATGLSRVSARRYLEHLCAEGRAQVAPRHGRAGRPENRYRLNRTEPVSRSGPHPSGG